MAIPCRCCPVGLTCFYFNGDPVGDFESATVLSNPVGFGISPSLDATIDGDPSGLSFGRIQSGETHNTQVDIEYALPFTARNVSQFSIWNNHGGITTDNDGIDGLGVAGVSGTRFQVLDEDRNVLYDSATFNAVNGPGPNVTSFGPLDGVRYVRLIDVKSLAPIGAVDTGWRLVRLNGELANRTAIAVVCEGEIRWFDTETGDEVDPGEVYCRPCGGPQPATVSDLHLRVMSISYDNTNPTASDEEVGNFSVAPTGFGPAITVSSNPGFWHPPMPSNTATLAPCDGGAMTEFDWTGTPVGSLDWTYRFAPDGDGPGISGNTFYFNSASLGPITFPASGALNEGQFVDSLVLPGGIFVRYTHISGAGAGGNRPSTGSTGCGSRITEHGGSTSLADQPIVNRIEFFRLCDA